MESTLNGNRLREYLVYRWTGGFVLRSGWLVGEAGVGGAWSVSDPCWRNEASGGNGVRTGLLTAGLPIQTHTHTLSLSF